MDNKNIEQEVEIQEDVVYERFTGVEMWSCITVIEKTD